MLGYQSEVVNGQLINTPTVESYLPVSYAPVAPSALWASMGPATVPPQIQAALAAAPTQSGGATGMPEEWTHPQTAAGWLHPTRYPVAVAVFFLVAGIAILRFVHWHG